MQLASIEKLERALALFMVVAWRIAQLMRLGRTCPELEAELLFDRREWQAAYILSQNLAPSVCSIHSPRTSLRPVASTPQGQVHGLVLDRACWSFVTEIDRLEFFRCPPHEDRQQRCVKSHVTGRG